MAKIIGIDLGTSNSAASVLEGGKPKIIPSAEGNTVYGKAFPSYVAFSKDGKLLVGEPARRQAVTNPDRTITKAKRKMGTDYKYKIDNKDYTPQQISAFILQKIKRDAESFLGDKVEKAVITVPAYFDDNQRQATKDAGQIAGLEVVRIINEPTAAALAYGLDKKGKDSKIMVFDLGGGTLDVTIMELGGGIFEVKSTSGDTQLGGTDMDETLLKYVVDQFKAEQGVDLMKDSMAVQRVREAAEKAKIELSTVTETDINLPYITATPEGPKHLVMKLNRAKLEELIAPLVKRCEKPVTQALADAKITAAELDKLILVGGPTRMPVVFDFVKKITGIEPERGIDPMECVAMGAAVQGGVLAGEVKDVLLLDVTPLSLGIETLGGVFTKLIERNTTIPTKKSQVFSTAVDNQTAVDIHVLQGERPLSRDNKSLGRFQLTGILPAPRGMPQIEVIFDIDANGIVHVTAKDKGTGIETSIKIVASQKLNDEEIERMKKEAEAHADEDKKVKEDIEVFNTADATAYSTEKMLVELKDKLSDAQKKSITEKLDDLKAELAKEDRKASVVNSKVEDLNKALQAIGSEVYGKMQQDGAASGAGASNNNADEGNSNGEDKVVDAEFEDKSKDKKK
ncbi:MAG: molecular chaperone DnaK [archaeon]